MSLVEVSFNVSYGLLERLSYTLTALPDLDPDIKLGFYNGLYKVKELIKPYLMSNPALTEDTFLMVDSPNWDIELLKVQVQSILDHLSKEEHITHDQKNLVQACELINIAILHMTDFDLSPVGEPTAQYCLLRHVDYKVLEIPVDVDVSEYLELMTDTDHWEFLDGPFDNKSMARDAIEKHH